jgi:hypothetical protein
VRAAVHEVTGGHGTATARFVAKVARGFLRYLAATGRWRVATSPWGEWPHPAPVPTTSPARTPSSEASDFVQTRITRSYEFVKKSVIGRRTAAS